MSNIIITSGQCRAARELLNWSQKDLSEKSGVSQGTISNFENSNSQREMKIGTLMDITNTFENAGAGFFNEDDKVGVWIDN